MEKTRLVKSQEIDQNRDQSYKNIKTDLEKRLLIAKNESEFITLIFDVNNVLKTHNFDQKEKSDLRNFRQKIYDRKKKFQKIQSVKLQNDRIKQSIYNHADVSLRFEEKASRFDEDLSRNIQDVSRVNQDSSKNHHDFFQLCTKFKTLDFFFITKKIFTICLFGICACLTALFVWKQSIPLYAAVGFPEPKLCAIGTILMIVGFSIIYSITKSKIALILCIYISIYEIILIVSGTFRHDTVQIQNRIENNSELQWLHEQVVHSGELYQTAKAQFDNPNSKVFQNSWYKEKYMVPAWAQHASDQNKLIQKREHLSSETKNVKKDSILKILFRLGLVFLCMLSVHNFLKFLSTSFEFNNSKKREVLSYTI